jgi:parvulin-like peptidyl-prolyl isomerase
LAPRAAAELAISDALFAEGARGHLAPGAARSIERAAMARGLLEQLVRDAAQAGAPTQAELSEVMRERWVDVDRPAAVRTTHAVVLNDKPERDAAARLQAEKLAQVVSGATTDEELIRLAKDFKPEDGFEVRAEQLPFVTSDGRIFQRADAGFKPRSGSFDTDFARGANALQRPGDLSGPVKSGFGYHIIRLDERAPSAIVPAAELVERLAPEVRARRAGRARRELLDKLRPAAAVQLERAVDDLVGRVPVTGAP